MVKRIEDIGYIKAKSTCKTIKLEMVLRSLIKLYNKKKLYKWIEFLDNGHSKSLFYSLTLLLFLYLLLLRVCYH